jgi:bla regulator protein blaR1
MGVWRVKLLLPMDAADLTDDQLRMIMLHELAHIRRRDVAANWLLVAVRAAQWWNPVYWLASSRFNSLREQACDAFVLQRLAGQSSRNYGELLLALAERAPVPARWTVLLPVPILGFFLSSFRRRAITVRLCAISHAAIRPSRIQTFAIGFATLLLAFTGLTDAKPEAATVNQSFNSVDEWMRRGATKSKIPKTPVFPGVFVSADTLGHDPWQEEESHVTRVYDLEQVLRRIAGEDHTLEYARNELQATLGPSTPQNPAPSLLLANPKQQGSQPAPHYEWEGNMLTLTASKTAHDDLQQKLQAWSQSDLSQISIEARFLSINQEVVSKASIPWRYLAPGSDNSDNVLLRHQSSSQSTFQAAAQMEESVPIVYSLLNPRQTKSLVHAVLGNRRAKILQAPKITLFNGQQAIVSDVSQRPFVVGVRELAAGVYEPQTAVIDEGTKITLRPVLSADHSRVHLIGRLEFTRVGETRTASIESPATTNEEPVSVQVPNVKRLRIDIATELEDGHSLLLGSPHEVAVIQNSQHLYILLTPRLLEQAAN